MVNLGIVNNFSLLPPNTLRVVFQKSDTLDNILKIDKSDIAYLFFTFTPKHNFSLKFLNILKGIKAQKIVIDPTYLVTIYNLSLEDALFKWGNQVFPFCKNFDGVFFFKVNGYCLRNVFNKWSQKFTYVCFKEKYNLTQLEEKREDKINQPLSFWKLKWQND